MLWEDEGMTQEEGRTGSWKEWMSPRKRVKRNFRETEEQQADLEQEGGGFRKRRLRNKGGLPRISEMAGH